MSMMIRHLSCFALAACGCLGILEAVQCNNPTRVADVGADLFAVLDHCERLGRENRRQEDLDARIVVILARIKAKEVIARDLLENRLTLLEAAARLRELLDAAPPDSWKWLRRIEPANSDTEKLCRHIIDWVRLSPALTEQKAKQATALLTLELEEHLRNETLVLPPHS